MFLWNVIVYNVVNFALDLYQVNHSPSFTTDSPLDKEIKEGLMFDALNLLNFGACDRRKILEEDKKRVRDRLLQKQRPKEAKYVWCNLTRKNKLWFWK